ncbi:MAG: aminotransferase [Salinisphaera sp.]|uniref:aminotransferase n=1 Tax=Salinisphaera sp. TaxID=1914330 RepID=UPI003C7D3C59
MQHQRLSASQRVSTNTTGGPDAVHAGDNQVIHPWEAFGSYGNNRRTIIERGEGVYLYDTDGNALIDGPGGMWCVNVGHGRREIADAAAEQMTRLAYCSPWSLTTGPAAELGQRLTALAPGDLNHVFFTASGSAAIDSALRFVMFYNNVRGRPEKKHIITRRDAYHGSTYLSASVSGKGRDKSWFDFETDTVHFVSSPNPYRRPDGMSVETFCDQRIAELEATIEEVGAERVAAFVAEPILASGGVIVPPPGYHRKCLEICRRHDVLYISDEVVTAFGRLGHMFASADVFDIQPDIITTAKGITSGYIPLGAVFLSDRLVADISGDKSNDAIFTNGFTYSGHPVACAAALANLDIIEREGLLEHVREIGPYFQQRLAELRDLPIVGDVRGMGLVGCVECEIDSTTHDALERDYAIGNRIDAHCQELGLLVRPFVNMCVMSPPLTITREQIDDLVGILRTGIERATNDLRREGIF